MTGRKGKDPKSLVSEVMGKLGSTTPTTPGGAPTAASAVASEDDGAVAADLIELYFQLDDPVERDVAFEKLAALRVPMVTAFFTAMMQHDQDEHLRAAAAAELARRGDAAGLARLEADLREPDDLQFFTDAVQILGELRGPGFYDALVPIWHDPKRDPAERREAMVGMETVDPARAMQDFVAFIATLTDVHRLPDDQVEQAMAAFVRQAHTPAVAALQGLRERIVAARWEDPDEGKELADFVQEGIELLQA